MLALNSIDRPLPLAEQPHLSADTDVLDCVSHPAVMVASHVLQAWVLAGGGEFYRDPTSVLGVGLVAMTV